MTPALLHEFLDLAAGKWPDAIAIDVPPGSGRVERRTITYADLRRQSRALACALQPFARQGCIIAILLPRDSERIYAAQVAVMNAGAAYLCIDPAFPNDQIRQILDDSGAAALLSDAEGIGRSVSVGFDKTRTVDVTHKFEDYPGDPPHPEWLTPDSLAYVIYTSGTTGRPKGVMISHRSIANLVGSDLGEFGLGPGDRVAQSSSAAYDSSVEEIWLAFASGAALVLLDDETARLGPDLVPWLQRERITVLCPPPTLLRATGCEDPANELPDLRLLYVGGEALTPDVADRWAPGRRLENGYGPTECTVTALRTRIVPGEEISIGLPVPGLNAWVLDDALNEVTDGTPGELCLGGIGLAAGYHNRPDLNAEKFPVHPGFGRIYRTGDLVHRAPDGNVFYHGRIDSQIKLRGYRIELEAIESCLARCEGVREAAVCVRGDGPQQGLAAFIVPADPAAPPAFEVLRTALTAALPVYMVPSRYAILTELPKSIGGKIRRDDLPAAPAVERIEERDIRQPRDAVEACVVAAFERILDGAGTVSLDDDFFHDLGGSSLTAAQVVSLLRGDPRTTSATVRDLYEARTAEELARRIEPAGVAMASGAHADDRPKGKPVGATLLQAAWLLAELMIASPIAYALIFWVLPVLMHGVGLVPLILLAPFFGLVGLATYTPLAVVAAVAVKKALIGAYRPAREPVWGSLYVRNWMVEQAVRIIPWALLAGTEYQCMALRALGARIGSRVHIHRGVNLLQGGWDLLEIGDDVTIAQDAAIRLVDLEDAQIVVGPVTLGSGSTLEVRSGVGPFTVLEPDAYLTALSSLPEGGRIPRGERWSGIPARPAGYAPPAPEVPASAITLAPALHGAALILSEFAVITLLALPFELLSAALVLVFRLDPDSIYDVLLKSTLHVPLVLALIGLVVLPLPFTVALEALACRALGRVREGVISLWSPAYIRVWLKSMLVDSGNAWLSGAMFWPMWLRLAGMKVGPGSEISTVIDVVPELVEIGPDTFFADGIYLGAPIIHRGTVSLKPVVLGANTFVGNHAVIPAGQTLPPDILLGVCTVADDTIVRPGSSWFGHPPFELPRREIVECDRSLTHNPSLIRYLNRLAWECLRFTLPIVPMLVFLGWMRGLEASETAMPLPWFLVTAAPLWTFGAAAVMCGLLIAMKWALLGRVKPGTHPLWSCWCSRWDFLYVAWGVFARGTLASLEGTLMLTWYLRLTGMKIGKRVVLGSGFAQVVDPDMLQIDDDATVHAMFQAHTFEDRVLKIDRVHVRRGATLACATVPLYGADIGEGTQVAAHSVIMKRERLLPGLHYEGAPTRPRRESEMAALPTDEHATVR